MRPGTLFHRHWTICPLLLITAFLLYGELSLFSADSYAASIDIDSIHVKKSANSHSSRLSLASASQTDQTVSQTVADPATTPQPPIITFSLSPVLEDFTSSGPAHAEPEITPLYSSLFQASFNQAPELRLALANKQQKQAERYTALAKRISPAITGKLSQVHEIDMDEDATDATTASNGNDPSLPDTYIDDEDHTDWQFDLNLPIYNRSVSLNLESASLARQIADNDFDITVQELDINLRELLANYLVANYRLLNLQNSVALSREHVARIRRGYELRDQTKLQLLRAEANLKELEAQRDLDKQQRDAAFRSILDFTGLDRSQAVFGWLRTLSETEQRTAGCINSLSGLKDGYRDLQHFIEEASDEDLHKHFHAHSLLFKRLELSHQLAASHSKRHTQENWPGLSLEGEYGRQEDTEFSDYDGEGSLSLVFSVPLFTGGTVFSNKKAQAMALRTADVSRYAELRKTLHSMENHRNFIRNLRRVYYTQLIHLKQQQEIVRLSLKSYQIKQTSMQDLLTSKNRLIDAKNALMETTASLGNLYRRFAWELGVPLTAPSLPTENTTISQNP